MGKEIQDEKIVASLKKMGETLFLQRTIVEKKEISDFVDHLNNFSNITYTTEIIEFMEKGEPVLILYWLNIWLYFQNLDKIVQAYDAKEMMFLAQQEFIPNIEKDIISHHNKK